MLRHNLLTLAALAHLLGQGAYATPLTAADVPLAVDEDSNPVGKILTANGAGFLPIVSNDSAASPERGVASGEKGELSGFGKARAIDASVAAGSSVFVGAARPSYSSPKAMEGKPERPSSQKVEWFSIFSPGVPRFLPAPMTVVGTGGVGLLNSSLMVFVDE